jgi:hypothetical protein
MSAALVVLALTTAGAQIPNFDLPPKVGDHIRVHRAVGDSSFVSGRLRAIRADSLIVKPDSDDWSLSFGREDVAWLEVQRHEKTRDHAMTAMGLIGALAGGAVYVSNCLHDREACAEAERRAEEASDCDSNYVSPGSIFVLAGALAGSLLGYVLAPAPQWDIVAFPIETVGPDNRQHLGLNIGFRYSLGGRRR